MRNRRMIALFAVVVGMAMQLPQQSALAFHPTSQSWRQQRRMMMYLQSKSLPADSECPVAEPAQSATIIGAGPAGLATALMLAQRGMSNIHVYERLPAPAASDDVSVWSDTAKFYLIGLGGRGQKALHDLDQRDGESTRNDSDDNSDNNASSSSLWAKVDKCCVTVRGRKDWAPGAGVDEGVERIFGDDRPYKTKVIPRDRLAGVLREEALDTSSCYKYAERITLHYDTEMTAVRWEHPHQYQTNEVGNLSGSEETAVITLQKCNGMEPNPAADSSSNNSSSSPQIRDVRCQLLVGADGTARTLATAMESHTAVPAVVNATSDDDDGLACNNLLDTWNLQNIPLFGHARTSRSSRVRVVRYKDDNRRVYKTVPLTIPVSDPKGGKWRGDVNYSARTKDGRVILDALPANTDGDYCAVLLLKADDIYAQPNSSASGLRELVKETLPQFSPLISDDTIAKVAKKPPSNIPRFRYVGPALHLGSSTVLLGDAIHTVKPYFGLGVNSALEDVIALRTALDQHPLDRAKALAAYSTARAEEAEALVRISRGLDRPGLLGFLTFILPIILDGVFQSVAPRFFDLNTIALLQRDGISFAQVGAIKRRDRALQIVVIGLGAVATSALASALLSTAAVDALPGQGVGIGLLVFTVLGAAQVLRVWEPGMAPADVLAKTLQPVTDVISAEDRGTVADDVNDNDDDEN